MNEISLFGSSVLGDLLKYPLILLLGITLSWLFTPIAIKFARRTGMLDRPDSRRLHTVATPRSGGLALFLSTQICIATSLYFPWGDEIRGSLTKEWWYIHLLSSSILLIVGVLDDLFQISWFLKLAGQVAACSIAFSLGLNFNFLGTFELAAGWDYLLTMLWFLGIINAFNLIDGMDGLAAGLAAVASIGLAIAAVFQRAPLDTLIWISLAASSIGFLRYNFHPAQVFLGDAGSMFLGFAIASITLQTSTKSTAIASIGLPLLAVGVPVFDTMLALWRRSVRSIATRKTGSWLSKLASPDKEHLHHRLLEMGLTQRKVAVLLYMTSIGLVGIGLLSVVFREQSGAIFIVAILLGSYVALKHIAATELWDSGAALVRGLRKPSTPVVTMTLYPAIDLCFLLVGLIFASLLLENSSSIAQAKIDFLSRVPIWCGVPFIVLIASATYQRVWSRARISEFLRLGLMLGFATTLVVAFELLKVGSELRPTVVFGLVFIGFAGFGISAIRAAPRAVFDLMSHFKAHRELDDPNCRAILVYGAGMRGMMYLKNLSLTQAALSHEQTYLAAQVIGFIDDDRNLRHRVVFGQRVLGEGSELQRLALKHRIDTVVVAANLGLEKSSELIKICDSLKIKLFEWQLNEVALNTLAYAQSPTAIKDLGTEHPNNIQKNNQKVAN